VRTYLDHNATSPLRPAARDALLKAIGRGGNASSIHGEGRAARSDIETAREALASRIGASPQMVVFTSGGTEANNLAVKGIVADRIVVSAVEHPSIIDAARAHGVPLDVVPVDGEGRIDTEELARCLDGSRAPALVSVMLANNETGVVQPVREIVEIARTRNALVHTDAVQALGKIDVNFPVLGVDLMTVSGHKFGAPVGVGALIVRDRLKLAAQSHGGGQELRRRAGTENHPAIAGFGAAVATVATMKAELRDRFEAELRRISPDVTILGGGAERLPNTSCFAVRDIAADTALISLDLDGVAVSSGSACSSGKVGRSSVLEAMGVSPELAGGAIRVSFGWNSTERDIESFTGAWRRIVDRKNKKAA